MTTLKPIRALIVDDEALARSIVREHLAPHRDISIVAECANGFEAVKAITELEPELVFLDIQMPKLNGFEVLDLVDGKFAVIFVTAHDEHAVKAFEVNALDYLLKPFSKERFERSLERAVDSIRARTMPSPHALAAAAAPPAGVQDRVLVRDGSHVHVIPVESIDFIEAQDDYIQIRTAGRKHLKLQPINEIEQQLAPARFVRIHRSTILNIDRLARIELYAKDSRVAILKDGTRLNVSRTGYEKLKSLLKA